jgi:hypothetical protein
MIPDIYNKRSVLLYNVHFKDGSLANCVKERAICGLRPVDIAWVWNVSERLRVAADEIRKLCKLVTSFRGAKIRGAHWYVRAPLHSKVSYWN